MDSDFGAVGGGDEESRDDPFGPTSEIGSVMVRSSAAERSCGEFDCGVAFGGRDGVDDRAGAVREGTAGGCGGRSKP
ncbi:hypothetical protein [Diaminobutyricibacter sp. McL0608]|uniref:hypothetical protein n=1 Tax=Leifsonia sp. McL0608 TaxID=3143537 RepID=UPI0031F308D5